MPQIYDMGPTALLPLRRKACWGVFRPKNPTASTLPLDHRSRFSQDITRLKWNSKPHSRIQKSPRMVLIIRQMNPAHSLIWTLILFQHMYRASFIIFIITNKLTINITKVYITAEKAVAQWLRRCATNQKVAGYIPSGVNGIFHWHIPSDHTMALGSTQPLIEMSTRSISWGKKRPVRKPDNLTTILDHCHVIWKP